MSANKAEKELRECPFCGNVSAYINENHPTILICNNCKKSYELKDGTRKDTQ